MFVAGILNASIPSAAIAYALLSLTTGMTLIINATVPLFGALLAWLWLSQRPSKLGLVGLAAGFIGVAALAWDTTGFKDGANGYASAVAMLSAAAGAASGAFSALFARRYLLGVPPLALAAGSQVGASPGLALSSSQPPAARREGGRHSPPQVAAGARHEHHARFLVHNRYSICYGCTNV